MWTKCKRNDGRKRCPPVINSTLDFPDPIPLRTRSRCVRTHVACNARVFPPSQCRTISFYSKRPIFHATVLSLSLSRIWLETCKKIVNLSILNHPSVERGRKTVRRGRDNLPRQLSRVIENCTRNVCMLRSSAGIDHLLFTIDIRFATLLVRAAYTRASIRPKELESPRFGLTVLYDREKC